ncbi:uncharacterized protein LOC111699471 isoform X1 [Eurytemora carolleeae]|uniref:uncharacterized protein LOC111699471 isoform X1 n=1 Tax=Eurytemora carolleeae TaxID=1294199 RepID=UPI000C75F486|nr:uncharacterized protein LOC111699471 isoform X1 [Eurytemora carolleeae]|eukprot:XP_023325929.1 uncharacterized protein LOC111699471 isoform X1 [Eurytemora affinis]
MSLFFIFFLVFLFLHLGQLTPIQTFFLHRKANFRELNCWDCRNLTCVISQGPYSLPKQTTICYRAKPLNYDYPKEAFSTVVGLGVLNITDTKISVVEEIVFGEWLTGRWFGVRNTKGDNVIWIGLGESRSPLQLQSWRHPCLTLDMTTGDIAVFENGEKIFSKNDQGLIDVGETLLPTYSHVSAGCAYDMDNIDYSMYGQVTDVQVFNGVLSDQELKDLTGCRTFPEGDIVSWRERDWTIVGKPQVTIMETYDLENEICDPTSTSFHFIPIKLSAVEHMELCNRLSGRLGGYLDEAGFNKVVKFYSQSDFLQSSVCAVQKKDNDRHYGISTYISATDEQVEGEWLDIYNASLKVNHVPFADNRPYGGTHKYNCMTLNLDVTATEGLRGIVNDARVTDVECSGGWIDCGICQMEGPILKINVRGLCEQSTYDRWYMYNIGLDGLPFLRGMLTSTITFNVEQDRWEWFDRKKEGHQATISNTLNSLILGTQKVDFSQSSDEKCSKKGENPVKKITFSVCEPGEFTCTNSQCIDMEERCDQTSNCVDESDEENCRMINVKSNYNKKISPFKVDPITKANIPANVNISFVIRDVLKIEEKDHVYTMKFIMIMEWYDYRINYFNLKVNHSLNAMSAEEIQNLWIPLVLFENTETNEFTKGDDDTELTVIREGNFTRSADTFTEEINIFSGKDNRITFRRVYTKTFKCVYELQMYPFDTQRCTVNMVLRELDAYNVFITPDYLAMEGETILTQYIITHWKLNYTNPEQPTEGILVVITLKRRIMNEILTTYLPSLLILVMCYMTNFFKPFFFEAIVTVNLTAQLVLTTLFISVSASLPPTAYIKMIDVWLIFSQLIPFCQVILHTFIDMYRESEEREVNRHGTAFVIGEDGVMRPKEEEQPSKMMFQRTVTPVGVSVIPAWEKNLTNIDEKVQTEAVKSFYENASAEGFMARFGDLIPKVLMPVVTFIFSLGYWWYGLSHYFTEEDKL